MFAVVLVAGGAVFVKTCDGIDADFGADATEVAAMVVVFAVSAFGVLDADGTIKVVMGDAGDEKLKIKLKLMI